MFDIFRHHWNFINFSSCQYHFIFKLSEISKKSIVSLPRKSRKSTAQDRVGLELSSSLGTPFGAAKAGDKLRNNHQPRRRLRGSSEVPEFYILWVYVSRKYIFTNSNSKVSVQWWSYLIDNKINLYSLDTLMRRYK